MSEREPIFEHHHPANTEHNPILPEQTQASAIKRPDPATHEADDSSPPVPSTDSDVHFTIEPTLQLNSNWWEDIVVYERTVEHLVMRH